MGANPNAADVRRSMLNGVRWVAGGRAVSELVGFASTIVLARLISPAEFGTAVVALVVAALASVMVINSFASLLIQKPALEPGDAASAVTVNVVVGFALSVLVLVLAGPIASLTGSDSPDLIRLVSPVCVLAGLNAVPAAMLSRRLDFRTLSIIDVIALAIRVGVSVGLAAGGAAGTAIVAGAVAGQAATTLGAMLVCRPPAPHLRWRAVRGLVSFGAPNAASVMAFTGFQNIDYAVIGARLNPTQLAFYYRAFQYSVDYQSRISRILANMAFPVYSRLGDDHAEMRSVRSRVVRVHAAVIFPILAGYAVLAPTLIPWGLGARWSPAVAPSQYLVVAGAATAVLTGTGALVVALGRPGLLLRWNLGQLVCYAVVVYFVAPQGVTATAAAVAGFYLVQCVAASWFLLGRVVKVPVKDMVHELLGPCVGCAALVAGAAPVRWALAQADAPSVATLAAAGLVGVVCYLAALRFGFGAVWGDLRLLFRRLLQHESTAASSASQPGVNDERDDGAVQVLSSISRGQ